MPTQLLTGCFCILSFFAIGQAVPQNHEKVVANQSLLSQIVQSQNEDKLALLNELSQVVYHEHALNYDSIANETMKLAIHLKVWPVAFEQGSHLMHYYLDSLIQPKRALAIFD
ncbi:MAG: hypothetical protein KJN65_07490, partial [Croceitalea sp.]|nr:hypothetical protein [Croceitalea sp.]